MLYLLKTSTVSVPVLEALLIVIGGNNYENVSMNEDHRAESFIDSVTPLNEVAYVKEFSEKSVSYKQLY